MFVHGQVSVEDLGDDVYMSEEGEGNEENAVPTFVDDDSFSADTFPQSEDEQSNKDENIIVDANREPTVFEQMLGNSLYLWGSTQTAQGPQKELFEASTFEAIGKAKYVAIYFSASWCKSLFSLLLMFHFSGTASILHWLYICIDPPIS